MKDFLGEKGKSTNLFWLLKPFLFPSHLILFHDYDNFPFPLMSQHPGQPNDCQLESPVSVHWSTQQVSTRMTCLRTLVNPAARHTDNAAELPSPAPMGISLDLTIGQVRSREKLKQKNLFGSPLKDSAHIDHVIFGPCWIWLL